MPGDRYGEPLPAGLVEPKPQYIPACTGEQSVGLDLASIGATLQPGTTYHYRVAVSNGAQGAQAPDRTFTTPSAGAAGIVPSIEVSRYQTSPNTMPRSKSDQPKRSCEHLRIWAGQGLLSGCLRRDRGHPAAGRGSLLHSGRTGGQPRSEQRWQTLQPNSVYYYWITATNAAGESHREGGIFKTPQSPVSKASLSRM